MSCTSLAKIEKALCNRGTAKEVTRAWVVPEEDVTAIPAATNHVIAGDITLEADKYFYEIGIDKVGSSFKFSSSGEGMSKQFDNTAALFVNGVHADVSKVVTNFIRGNYIVIIQDKNGNRWLLGAVGDGAEIGVEAQNDRNGYTLSALWSNTDLPYKYTGTILTNEA